LNQTPHQQVAETWPTLSANPEDLTSPASRPTPHHPRPSTAAAGRSLVCDPANVRAALYSAQHGGSCGPRVMKLQRDPPQAEPVERADPVKRRSRSLAASTSSTNANPAQAWSRCSCETQEHPSAAERALADQWSVSDGISARSAPKLSQPRALSLSKRRSRRLAASTSSANANPPPLD
jgi:hypothetical protein